MCSWPGVHNARLGSPCKRTCCITMQRIEIFGALRATSVRCFCGVYAAFCIRSGQVESPVLRNADLVITRTQTEPSEEDPRDGSWPANIGACDPDVDRAGVIGTVGTAISGELVLLVEAGGPPASSGCVGL